MQVDLYELALAQGAVSQAAIVNVLRFDNDFVIVIKLCFRRPACAFGRMGWAELLSTPPTPTPSYPAFSSLKDHSHNGKRMLWMWYVASSKVD